MERMYLERMDDIVLTSLNAICSKARRLGVEENGIVTICCSEVSDSGVKCFDQTLGGDISHSFYLKDGLLVTDRIVDLTIEYDALSKTMKKIALATLAFSSSGGKQLTSSDSELMGFDGCVIYPLTVNDKFCGKIYISVDAGAQSEECAWAAHEAIVNTLKVCKTTNPGHDFYYYNK